ncbi:hypothetical protein Tco_0932173, partial [Tanacetum coccineum]
MTTPRPAPFPATTPSAGVFNPFVIISNSDDKITTLPVRPAPPSPDRIPALYGYPLDSGDDSSDEDLSETAKSLHTQTASILAVHPPPTQSLPTSPAFALLPSEIPSLSSPPSLLTSSPSPPPSLLPSSSHKRSRSPSPLLPSSVSPSPPSTVVPPPSKHIESVGDDIEASFWDLERHLAHRSRNVHETTEKIIQIKSRIQAARDHQKRYADVRCKPLEFQEDDKVMLKVSPWKGVIRFGKRGKLNPRYIGPFKVLAKVGIVVYKLELPQQLSSHSMFHVSNLKKCLFGEPMTIPLDEIHIDDKLHFVEEPVKIMDREVKRLKQSHIPIIKVRWNSRRGPEFTWEREDQ